MGLEGSTLNGMAYTLYNGRATWDYAGKTAAPTLLPATTSLSSSLNPSTVGTPVTLTATVTGSSPTGSVSLADGGSALSGCTSLALSGSGNTRTAACTTSSLAAGTHSIVASYSGDAANAPSSSTTLAQVVDGATSTATASFVGTDTTTQGNWKGVYGSDGYNVIGDTTSYPAYAQVTAAGATAYVWASQSTDPRALLRGITTGRIAATWYSATSFTVDVNLTDGNSHRVALYNLDWDTTARAQRIDILDASSGSVLDSRSVTNFHGGQYLVWTLSGHVTIRITMTAGYNAVLSGLFFDAPASTLPATTTTLASSLNPSTVGTPVTLTATVTGSSPTGSVSLADGGSALSGCTSLALSGSGNSRTAACTTSSLAAGTHSLVASYSGDSANAPSSSTTLAQVVNGAAASFVGTDTTTQGNWKGVYGSDGYNVIGDTTSYPAYAQVTSAGATAYVWASQSTDPRALLRGITTGRIAATWYSATSFTVDLNLTDGNSHRVALYNLDWDTTARAQRIDILDASSGSVLDSRSVTNFHGGQYLVWTLSGHVTIRITMTAGYNAVLSGLFFDAPASTLPATTTTLASSLNPATVGAPVTLTATVTGSSPTGSVSLADGGSALSGCTSLALSGSGNTRTAACTTSSLAAGTHSLVASYSGDSANAPSSSTTLAQVVNGAATTATASFVGTDTTTQGNWKGVYGSDGYNVIGDTTSYPTYAQVTTAGNSSWVWASQSTDPRALLRGVTTGRIAATWYSATSFTVDLNLTDGNPHRVALYNLDWDTTARAQRIDILDAGSGSVLDSRSISSFNGGQYLVWTLSGHVTIRITMTAGYNAVLSGLYFN